MSERETQLQCGNWELKENKCSGMDEIFAEDDRRRVQRDKTELERRPESSPGWAEVHWFVCIALSFFPSILRPLGGVWQRELKTKGGDRNAPVQFVSKGSRRWRLPHSHYPLSLSGPQIGDGDSRGSGDPKIRLWNAETQTLVWGVWTHACLRHRPFLCPNKTTKQHACPPGPIKHFTQKGLKQFPHLSLYQSLMYRLVLG